MPDPAIMRLPEFDDATQLALERNRLAYERTMLAWVRTSIALISFGFTVYKLFQYLHESGQPVPHRVIGPREFGMAMIIGSALPSAIRLSAMKPARPSMFHVDASSPLPPSK